jgi:hypothetical protein
VTADAERQVRELRPEWLGAAGEDDRPVGTWLGVIAGQDKITVPLTCHKAPVNDGQPRSLADTWIPSSADLTAETGQIPKLIVRVRFPSPAPIRMPRSEGIPNMTLYPGGPAEARIRLYLFGWPEVAGGAGDARSALAVLDDWADDGLVRPGRGRPIHQKQNPARASAAARRIPVSYHCRAQ